MPSLLRRTPMALYNVMQYPVRTTVSSAGIAFALLLVFMQLGFLGAVSNTATLLYEQLNFDLIIRSPDYLHLYESRQFDQSWLAWCQGQADVEDVQPLWIDLTRWQNPRDNRIRAIALIGIRVDTPPFKKPERIGLSGSSNPLYELTNSRQLLIDQATRADFGPRNGQYFESADVGSEVMLGTQRMRIAGLVSIGTGLAANGQVLVGQSAFSKLVPWNANENCSLGLVRLKPNADPEHVARRLNALLRSGNRTQGIVEILSRKEALSRETKRWIDQTPIGAIFKMGVLLALMVGATVVYQVLSTDIANRMPEYATLKAMGHGSFYLSSLVLFQAWYLAVLSFLPAWLLSEVLYRFTAWSAGIPITMTTTRIAWVACAGITICTLSALAALNKIRRAEPAALF